ncbi:MAG: glycosyltransferase family 4 protein, partial [Winogradskyella sp.]|nr:glycosyltransferase family 4 protein [Winogradskyella sp.]
MAGHQTDSELTVGFITSEYPHPKVNRLAGIATSLKNLAVALVKENIRVIVFVYGQNTNDIVHSEDIEIHLIASKSYKVGGWYFYRKHINSYVEHVVRSEQINILEAPDWTGITAFMTFRVPLVIRFHGSDAYFCKLEGRKQKWKNYFFEKKAIKGAAAYIAPTSYAGSVTQEIFGIKKEKIKTIHYGLQLEKFVNESPEKYNRNTILYIGTIIRKKGVLELAEIFNAVHARQPDAKLVLIGSDSADLKTGNSSTFELVKDVLTQSAKASTSYLGKLPYNEVVQHIKDAHVCTFPSFAETLGMV